MQNVGPGRDCPKIGFSYKWSSITWCGMWEKSALVPKSSLCSLYSSSTVFPLLAENSIFLTYFENYIKGPLCMTRFSFPLASQEFKWSNSFESQLCYATNSIANLWQQASALYIKSTTYQYTLCLTSVGIKVYFAVRFIPMSCPKNEQHNFGPFFNFFQIFSNFMKSLVFR